MTPEDIKAGSEAMGEFNDDLKEQLDSLKDEMAEVVHFYERRWKTLHKRTSY